MFDAHEVEIDLEWVDSDTCLMIVLLRSEESKLSELFGSRTKRFLLMKHISMGPVAERLADMG